MNLSFNLGETAKNINHWITWMKKTIHQSHPFHYHPQKMPIAALLIGSTVFLFLIVFMPFKVDNLEEYRMGYTLTSLIQCLNGTMVFCLFCLFSRKWMNTQTWTIRKEIGYLILGFALIGIANYFLRGFLYDTNNNSAFIKFYEEVKNALLLSVLILTLKINLFRSNHAIQPIKDATENAKPISKPPTITIVSKHQQESIDLTIENFMVAKSEGNYVEIKVIQGQIIKKHLLRMSLKDLEKQLAAFPFLFKTHRSYIVNLKKIETAKGNAQGYQLKLNCLSEKIPVSRGRVVAFNQSIS